MVMTAVKHNAKHESSTGGLPMPLRPIDDPARATDLQTAMDDALAQMSANLNAIGYSTDEIATALEASARRFERAAEEDPDPADDPN
jgi:hypothetical protein